MQKLLLVAGSVAVCHLSGCGTSTATSCKLVDGGKQIDCAGISTDCCAAHHKVWDITDKEHAISVKDTAATAKKDLENLQELEKEVDGAIAAREEACKTADNAAAQKCYTKTDSGPAAEMFAAVPPDTDSAPLQCVKKTGGSCSGGQCDPDRDSTCNTTTDECECGAEMCATDHLTEIESKWEFWKFKWPESKPKKVCKPQDVVLGTTDKDAIQDQAAELAQLKNQAFAGLAGFVAGGVVMVAVAKVRTSSMRTAQNSF